MEKHAPVLPALVMMIVAGCVALTLTQVQAATPPPPQQQPATPKGVVIRGCLTGSKLSHVDPDDATLQIPDVLQVASLRVIRSQVKALNGHQVEVIGSLRGIAGLDKGLLVSDSDKAKFYVGSGDDTSLGEDLGTRRIEPPTVYVRTIKDLAPACTQPAAPAK